MHCSPMSTDDATTVVEKGIFQVVPDRGLGKVGRRVREPYGTGQRRKMGACTVLSAREIDQQTKCLCGSVPVD